MEWDHVMTLVRVKCSAWGLHSLRTTHTNCVHWTEPRCHLLG